MYKMLEMRQELDAITSKANSFNVELAECQFLIESMSAMDPSRRAFRKVGDLLIERSVKEVLNAVGNNKLSIRKMIDSIQLELKKRKDDVEKFQKHYETYFNC